MYTENTSDAWHIPRYPTRKHCITSIYYTILFYTVLYYTMLYYTILYYTLSHALKNTANQRPGLPLHILRYATSNMQRKIAQQFTGVHLRTSQMPPPKLFNSCQPLRTFPITSGNFPKISEHFQRFSEVKLNFKNVAKCKSWSGYSRSNRPGSAWPTKPIDKVTNNNNKKQQRLSPRL